MLLYPQQSSKAEPKLYSDASNLFRSDPKMYINIFTGEHLTVNLQIFQPNTAAADM